MSSEHSFIHSPTNICRESTKDQTVFEALQMQRGPQSTLPSQACRAGETIKCPAAMMWCRGSYDWCEVREIWEPTGAGPHQNFWRRWHLQNPLPSWAPSSIKNIKNDILQLHWYKCLNIKYSNMCLDLKYRVFLLILKEIKTYLWAPQRLLGRQ